MLVFVVLLACVAGYWWRAREAGRAADIPAATTSGTIPGTSAAGTATATANPAATSGQEPSSAEIAENASLEGALGLALQGISLFSGEKGAELWRLKASFAHLTREGGNIDVDAPTVRYTLGNPGEPDFQNDFMDVKANKGRITDNQRFINLWDNVDVRRFDEVITGPRLEYDSQNRIMVFPDGAALDGPKASGEAGLLTWDLGSNTLIAENDVTVIIKPVPDEPETSDAEAAPEGSDAAVQATPNTPAEQKPAVTPAPAKVEQPKAKQPKAKQSKVKQSSTGTSSSKATSAKTSTQSAPARR